jgi:hypothetical protein
MQKLSEMFPDAQVSVTYADEDLGQNCGRYSFLNGEETELYQPEGGSDEAMNLAIEIKGYQDELYKDEATGEWRWHSDDEQDDHTAEIENQAEAEANEG